MKRATLLTAILVVAVLSPAGALGTAAATATDATNAVEQDCTFPVTKTDATGTEVTVDAEPQRIVTLSPSAAQTAWEIGAKDKVVGVTKYASYLDGTESKANVSGSGMTTVVREKVVAQNPDLVLAPNIIPDQTVQKLRDAGLTVYKFRKAKSIEGVYAKTTRTGQLTGECAGANETVDWMKDRVGTVEQAVEGEESSRVLYSMRGGYTAGEGTFINKIIEAGGGTNVAAEAGISGYKSISKEVVVERNPQWIVFDSDRSIPEEYGATAAAKNDQTVVLNRNYVNQPGPRIVLPITKLAKTFHPEAYEQANVTTTTTTTADDGDATTTTADDGDATTTTVESSGQPGFGAGVAAVALAGVALLARRE